MLTSTIRTNVPRIKSVANSNPETNTPTLATGWCQPMAPKMAAPISDPIAIRIANSKDTAASQGQAVYHSPVVIQTKAGMTIPAMARIKLLWAASGRASAEYVAVVMAFPFGEFWPRSSQPELSKVQLQYQTQYQWKRRDPIRPRTSN